MKFLLDENIPLSALDIFKELGLEALHVNQVNMRSATDQEIMAYAKKTKSIIVTRDLDFGTLIVVSRISTYGVVVLRLPFSFTAAQIKSNLKVFLKTVILSKLAGTLVIVELGRYRIRKI